MSMAAESCCSSAADFDAFPMTHPTCESKCLKTQAFFLQRNFLKVLIDAHLKSPSLNFATDSLGKPACARYTEFARRHHQFKPPRSIMHCDDQNDICSHCAASCKRCPSGPNSQCTPPRLGLGTQSRCPTDRAAPTAAQKTTLCGSSRVTL